MNRVICLTSVVLSYFIASSQSLTDVSRKYELTYYGIDFTLAKFLNFPEKQYIGSSSEDTKKIVQSSYNNKKISNNTLFSESKNSSLDMTLIQGSGAYEIDAEKVKSVVSGYPIEGTGFGLLYVVESFENTRAKGYVWVVYFDQSNKKVISLTRYTGFYNGDSWGQAIKSIIKRTAKDLKAYK